MLDAHPTPLEPRLFALRLVGWRFLDAILLCGGLGGGCFLAWENDTGKVRREGEQEIQPEGRPGGVCHRILES